MRPTSLVTGIATVLGLLTTLTSCKPKPAQPLPAGAVSFQSTGVALVPGESWLQISEQPSTRAAAGMLCPPVLQGKGEFNGSLIQVYTDPTDRSDPKGKAQTIIKHLQAQPDILNTSIRQEKFEAENGAGGIHLSYNQKMEMPGRKWLTRTHMYIVKNRQGRSVTICYVEFGPRESASVHEMIRKTLTLW